MSETNNYRLDDVEDDVVEDDDKDLEDEVLPQKRDLEAALRQLVGY